MKTKTAQSYKEAIHAWGADIYTPISIGDPEYWIPPQHLESLLNIGMIGLNLSGLPLRTRSKVVKCAVCEALGYPVPKSFKKTQPRFFGQQLDIYTQKSLNLQVWNEELTPTRRYAIIQVSAEDVILKVKVVSGQELIALDTTGAVTIKYQALMKVSEYSRHLISLIDTKNMRPYLADLKAENEIGIEVSPSAEPEVGKLLPIQEIFELLSPLVGTTFPDPGKDQERNRGAELHRLVCEYLGYSHHEDNGKFPDVRHQLLEVKLQTSPTIDLGLVLPSSTKVLDVRQLGTHHPRYCDIRYAIFQAKTDGETVTLKYLHVSTGESFFHMFPPMKGKVKNWKIQIPLPRDFFGN